MKKILTVVLVFGLNSLYACSIVCGVSGEFDPQLSIYEGEVIGHEGNFELETKTGVLKIKVSKVFYSPLRLDTVHLIISTVNSMCKPINYTIEVLKESYPKGTKVSFVSLGFEKERISLKNLLLSGTCSPYGKYLMSKKRKRYNYKKEQLAESEHHQFMKTKPRGGNFDYSKYNLAEKQRQKYLKNLRKNVLYESLQVHLDLLKIFKTKSKKKQYRLFKRLVWSNYYHIDQSGIEQLNLPEKYKVKLKKEAEVVKGTRERMY